MEFLYQKLEHYHEKNIYPFHMPGHKRNEKVVDFLPDLTKDITEIQGFDYLHRPTGILRESQMAAARLYGGPIQPVWQPASGARTAPMQYSPYQDRHPIVL